MPDKFNPIKTVEGWQLSNPHYHFAIRHLLVFLMKWNGQLLQNQLTNYLRFLLNSIENDKIEIITPKKSGCQLSIVINEKTLFDMIKIRSNIRRESLM